MLHRLIIFLENHTRLLGMLILLLVILTTIFIIYITPSDAQIYRAYYLKGIEAQQNGIPPDACPYSMGDWWGGNTQFRTYWMFGWTDSKLNKVKQ